MNPPPRCQVHNLSEGSVGRFSDFWFFPVLVASIALAGHGPTGGMIPPVGLRQVLGVWCPQAAITQVLVYAELDMLRAAVGLSLAAGAYCHLDLGPDLLAIFDVALERRFSPTRG